MKVLVITNTIEPNSGWGRYSLGVINEFKRQGIECKVFLPATTHSFWGLISNAIQARKLAKDVHVIHAFDAWPYALYACWAVFGRGKSFFVNAVGTYSVASMKKGLKGLVMRVTYKRAKAVFAISDFIKEKVLENVRLKNISTVYLGHTALPSASLQKINYWRQKLHLENSSPILLTVGEVKNRKGQYDVVEAVNLLKGEYPNIKYLIVGKTANNTAYLAKIEGFLGKNLLDKNVKIVSDAKEDSDLAALYSLCDVFILASKEEGSHFEGFGLVLLEAAQFGKAVIGAKSGGIAEAMQDGYNGLLAEPGNPSSIAFAIKSVLAKKEEYGRNSRQIFEKFDYKNTVEAYLKKYSENTKYETIHSHTGF